MIFFYKVIKSFNTNRDIYIYIYIYISVDSKAEEEKYWAKVFIFQKFKNLPQAVKISSGNFSLTSYSAHSQERSFCLSDLFVIVCAAYRAAMEEDEKLGAKKNK